MCNRRKVLIWSVRFWLVAGIIGLTALIVTPVYGDTLYIGPPDLCNKQADEGCLIAITGEISAKDVGQFKAIRKGLELGKKGRVYVVLDSVGGDAIAAMELGRSLRASEAKVFVQSGAKCISACVFVLAGGVQRTVLGTVGIHRPYWTSIESETRQSKQRRFNNLDNAVRRYLKEMNIPALLWDEMVGIPPEQVRFLPEAELARYTLNAPDPVEQEINDANEARRRDLTKQQYLERKNVAIRICTDYEFKRYTGKEDLVSRLTVYKECEEKILSVGTQ